jgi:hypothetical protein
MRVTRALIVVLSIRLFLFTSSAAAQSTKQAGSQASTILQGSLKACLGGSAVNDVTLTGTVERIAGSDDESGSATYRALAGSNRLDMVFAEGTHTEIRTTGGSGPSGSWRGVDGVSHPISRHNLITGIDLIPAFLIASLLDPSKFSLAYVGLETVDNSGLTHIGVSENTAGLPEDQIAVAAHLSQVDLYVDASTQLLSKIAFNQHPDNNFQIDIPTEIRYSDYRLVDGVEVPYRIQKYVNNNLTLDIQVQSAVLNSGISPNAFQVQ